MNAIVSADVSIRGSPSLGTPIEQPQGTRPIAEVVNLETRRAPVDLQGQPQEVEQVAEGVNAFLKSSGSHVQLALHREANRMMVEVIDDKTQEVIKTIPAKEILDLAAKIGEMVGVLLDKKG